MRKVLSFVLVLSLVLGSFGFAFAAPSDVAGTKNEMAVDVLMALDVINGYEDGTYRPENIVTRAEMAKILIAASGYGDIVNEAKSSFSDMAGHWADKYVAYAASLGLVNGYPDGTFKPNATVSYAEAATMMVRALGYTDASLAGTWPANYVTRAMVLGLYDKVSTKVGGANRGDIAEMIFALLDEDFGKVDKDNIFVPDANGDTMLKRLGTTVVYGQTIDETYYGDSLVNLRPYVGQVVDLYKQTSGDEKYVAVKKVYSDVITGTYDNGNNKLKTADGTEYTIDITAATTFFTNGEEMSAKVKTFASYDKKTVTVSGKLSGLTMKAYSGTINGSLVTANMSMAAYLQDDLAKVATSDLDDIEDIMDKVANATLFGYKVPLKPDKTVNYSKMAVVGDATKLEDIKKDDIVTIYTNDADDTIAKLEVSREILEGKVTKITAAPERVYLDGKAYEVDANAVKAFATYTLGDEIKAKMTYAGKLADYTVVDSATAGNYAIVIETFKGDSNFGIPAKIQLLTKNGDLVKFDINKNAKYNSGASGSLLDAAAPGTTVQIDPAVEAVLTAGLAVTSIVEYATNASGEITNIILKDGAASSETYNDRTKYIAGKQLASNVVIFKYNTTDKEKSSIITEDKLSTSAAQTLYTLNSAGTQVAAIAVITTKTPDDIYGPVISVGSVLDEDDITVQEVNMLVNGEAKTYITDSAFGTTINPKSFYLIKLSNGKISTGTTEDATLANITGGALKVSKLDSDNRVITTVGGLGQYEYGADATVYVATFKTNGTFDKWVASTMSVVRADAYAYIRDVYNSDERALNLDPATNDIYDTIFVIKEADLSKVGL